MSTSGNGHNPAEACAEGAVCHEDIHDHAVTLARHEGPAGRNSFHCHTRRWYVGGADAKAGMTALLIPGIGHNVNFFGPLAQRLLDPEGGVAAVSQVVAVDLPGHGGSHVPPHAKFGRLTLGDYVDAVFQIVADLRARGLVDKVELLCGHSMGGMVAQLLAQACVDRRTTLKEEWGTWCVVMLASALPEGVPWLLVDGRDEDDIVGPVLAKLAPYLTTSLRYGVYLAALPEDYLLQFYAVDAVVVPTAPSLIEAVSLNGPEAFAAARELCGLDFQTRERLERPNIDKGIFRDYALGVVSYEEDALFRPFEEHALGEHLFGDEEGGWTHLRVEGSEAVHCMPYSVPSASLPIFEKVTAMRIHTREASEA
jgi:pimeloyl-ACP methyl ester carboxylesterase